MASMGAKVALVLVVLLAGSPLMQVHLPVAVVAVAALTSVN
jgi:hypothetical protein